MGDQEEGTAAELSPLLRSLSAGREYSDGRDRPQGVFRCDLKERDTLLKPPHFLRLPRCLGLRGGERLGGGLSH